jgi:hypothetical protein
MYQFISDIRKNFRHILTACRDSTGLILTEPSEIMEPWRQHVHNLLTDPYKCGDHPRIRRKIGKEDGENRRITKQK